MFFNIFITILIYFFLVQLIGVVICNFVTFGVYSLSINILSVSFYNFLY
jgi:hypothetical protein